MASTEKLPSGRWRAIYYDSAGEKCRVPGTFDRKSDARDAAIEAQAKAKRQAAANAGTLSANTPWGDWWDILAPDRDRPSDQPVIEAGVVKNHIRPRWGDVPLNRIERHRDVQPWVDSLSRKGYAPNTVHKIYAPFRTSISVAVDQGILTADPCSGVKLPKITKRPRPYIAREKKDTYIGLLKGVWADALELIMETGFRPGEVCGMHAEQSRDGWLMALYVYVPGKNMMRPWPKDGDMRAVPESSRAREIIERNLGDRTGPCGVSHHGRDVCRSALVLVRPDGRPLTPRSLYERMRYAALRDGLELMTPYGGRRGYATAAARGGVDPFALKDLMGHSTLDETDGYVQMSPDVRARLLAALGDAQPLKAVPDVGGRGMGHGTDHDRQPPESTGIGTDRQEA